MTSLYLVDGHAPRGRRSRAVELTNYANCPNCGSVRWIELKDRMRRALFFADGALATGPWEQTRSYVDHSFICRVCSYGMGIEESSIPGFQRLSELVHSIYPSASPKLYAHSSRIRV